jgi:hypothetical protein
MWNDDDDDDDNDDDNDDYSFSGSRSSAEWLIKCYNFKRFDMHGVVNYLTISIIPCTWFFGNNRFKS